MDEPFIEYTFKVVPKQPGTDILIAQLSELGFESFEETTSGLRAYIRQGDWNPDQLKEVSILSNPEIEIHYSHAQIDQQNWNETWETNFSPILIGRYCAVRAPFHAKPDVQYDIVIAPKMSFGTGHHETTHMMLQFILREPIGGKKVLDMGCGTAVLAILASMKGAAEVLAIDKDPWSFANARENVSYNKQDHIEVLQGQADSIGERKFDIILANINRNTLLEDIPVYTNHLNPGGALIVSGFYKADLYAISEKCGSCGLSFQENLENNDWVSAKYVN